MLRESCENEVNCDGAGVAARMIAVGTTAKAAKAAKAMDVEAQPGRPDLDAFQRLPNGRTRPFLPPDERAIAEYHQTSDATAALLPVPRLKRRRPDIDFFRRSPAGCAPHP